jgi:hypothetical protein
MEPDVKLIFVKEFTPKFKAPASHPKAGHVYRAIKRDAPAIGNFYQLLYDNKDDNNLGMFIPRLVVDNPFYKCDMVEIEYEDLLDLDVDDSIFEKINEWGEDLTKGIDDKLLNRPTINNIDNEERMPIDKFIKILAEGISEAITDKEEQEIKEEPKRLIERNPRPQATPQQYVGLAIMEQEDPDFFKALTDMTNYFGETYGDKYRHSPMGNPGLALLYSKDHGKGANGYNSIKYIQRYMTEGFEKSGNPKDLYKAIHYILFELTRLQIHGQN